LDIPCELSVVNKMGDRVIERSSGRYSVSFTKRIVAFGANYNWNYRPVLSATKLYSQKTVVLAVNRRRSSVSGGSSTVHDVTSANSLSAFQQQLKHTLFQQSLPDIIN